MLSHYPFGAIVIFDHDLRYVLARGEGLDAVGLSGDDVEGRTIWDVFGDEFASTFEEQYRRALRGERVEQHVPYEGRVYRTTAGPVYGTDGSVEYGLVITQDVTKQIEAESELQLLKASVEQSTESVIITDATVDPPGPRIVYVNSATEQMTGYAAEELIGNTPRLFQGEETSRRELDLIRRAVLAGMPIESETINYRKDGAPYIVRWNIAPVRNADGEVTHWVSVQRDVTNRRAMEENLRQERDLLSKVMQTSVAAIVICDRDGYITYSNPRAEAVLGTSRDEIRTRRFDDAAWGIRGADGSALDESELPFNRVVRTGEAVENVILTIRTSKGRARVLSVNAAPVPGMDGSVDQVVFTLEDVTAKHDQDEQLRIQQAALDQAKEAIIILDASARPGEGRQIQYVNAAFEKMTGYSAEEVEGQSLQVLKGPKTSQETLQRIGDAYAETISVEAQLLNYRKDGSAFWAEVAIAPVFDADGQLRNWISIQRDVTTRRKTEAALRESKSYAEQLIANMQDGFLVVDREQRLVQVNEAFCQMTGFSEDDLLGQTPPYPFWVENEVVQMQWAFTRMKAETGREFELTFRRKSGETFPVQVYPSVLRDEGDVLYTFATVRDVSVRKEYEVGLIEAKVQAEKAREEAEEMNRLKTSLLTNMSHEIRTPLTSIIGFADALTEAVDEETSARFADLIHESGERLMETLNSVLDLAKLEAGALTLNREPTDVVLEIHGIVRELRPLAEKGRLRLTCDVPDAPVRAMMDRVAFTRIIRNLVSNAVKFTPVGGAVTVRLRWDDAEGETSRAVVVEVEDTGVGIAEDFLPDLFKPFRQESTGSTREFQGSGLGLTITRQLVTLSGGTIDVESVKGEGTTFRVRLPQ